MRFTAFRNTRLVLAAGPASAATIAARTFCRRASSFVASGPASAAASLDSASIRQRTEAVVTSAAHPGASVVVVVVLAPGRTVVVVVARGDGRGRGGARKGGGRRRRCAVDDERPAVHVRNRVVLAGNGLVVLVQGLDGEDLQGIEEVRRGGAVVATHRRRRAHGGIDPQRERQVAAVEGDLDRRAGAGAVALYDRAVQTHGGQGLRDHVGRASGGRVGAGEADVDVHGRRGRIERAGHSDDLHLRGGVGLSNLGKGRGIVTRDVCQRMEREPAVKDDVRGRGKAHAHVVRGVRRGAEGAAVRELAVIDALRRDDALHGGVDLRRAGEPAAFRVKHDDGVSPRNGAEGSDRHGTTHDPPGARSHCRPVVSRA